MGSASGSLWNCPQPGQPVDEVSGKEEIIMGCKGVEEGMFGLEPEVYE